MMRPQTVEEPSEPKASRHELDGRQSQQYQDRHRWDSIDKSDRRHDSGIPDCGDSIIEDNTCEGSKDHPAIGSDSELLLAIL